MSLPNKFSFLNTLVPLPKLVSAALEYFGLKEIKGEKNNSVIMGMAKDLGIANIYVNDEMSWCALFISFLLKKVGKPLTFSGYELIRASSFSQWGNPVLKGQEKLGDILVFSRPGGAHVGIYVAESKETFFVLGGNQSDSVSITEISKSRLVAARRFYSIAPPSTVDKYIMDSNGLVSTNEA